MSRSEDINTLFRRFGGDVSDYQEIVGSEKDRNIKKAWPLLAHVDLNQMQENPAVHVSEPALDSVPHGVDASGADKKSVAVQNDHSTHPLNQPPVVVEHSTTTPEHVNIFAKFTQFPTVDGDVEKGVVKDAKLTTIFSRLSSFSHTTTPAPQALKKSIKW